MNVITPDTLARFERRANEATDMLKALSNPHRLLLLCQLGDGELSVGELQSRISLSQSALSQHLARLRDDALVTSRRDGTSIFYRITNRDVMTIISTLAEIYCPPEDPIA